MNVLYGINTVAEALKARGRAFEWVGVATERKGYPPEAGDRRVPQDRYTGPLSHARGTRQTGGQTPLIRAWSR